MSHIGEVVRKGLAEPLQLPPGMQEEPRHIPMVEPVAPAPAPEKEPVTTP